MTNHIPNPLRAAEVLVDATLQQHGPEFLRRGGAVGRAHSEVAKGAAPLHAASIAAGWGKGHAAELRLAAEHTVDAGLHDEPYFTQPNSVANHPHADLLVRDGGRVVRTVQVGVGKLGYLKPKARRSRAAQVVVPTATKDKLVADGHPASQRLSDRVTYGESSSKPLTEQTAFEDARAVLLRALEADARVGEWAKWSLAVSGGLTAAADSFGTSLLYEVVEKLWTGQRFDNGMIERACLSAGRVGVRSTLQTYLAVDDFLSHARRAFNGRIVQRVAGGIVWTGALADVVISTAVEVWRWMKSEISFEELLRRFGVHVTSGVGGAIGVGAALMMARGAPAWVQVVLLLGLGWAGWKLGRAVGDDLFRAQWEQSDQGVPAT